MTLSRRGFFGAGAVAASAVTMTPQALWATPLKPATSRDADGYIHLNYNENPYGPLPSMQEAYKQAFTLSHRYADDVEEEITKRLAARHKVSPNQLIVGCGSTEMLKIAASACLRPGRKLVIADPTFENLLDYAKVQGAPIAKVPLTSTYAHDLEAMLTAAGTEAGLIYICNPNNPTGSLTSRQNIETFLSRLPGTPVVLIDEAYHDFAVGLPGYESFLDKPIADPRVVVLRTFSKLYGMAGLRLGYAVTPDRSDEARTFHDKFAEQQQGVSTNIAALMCGLAALEDPDGAEAIRRRIITDRANFVQEAAKRGLAVLPSATNFVMMDARRPAAQVNAFFKERKIRIGRVFAPYNSFVRISLGRPEEMQAFWRVWDQMPTLL